MALIETIHAALSPRVEASRPALHIAGKKSKHDELIALLKANSVANDILESKNIQFIHGIHGIYIVYNVHCVYG